MVTDAKLLHKLERYVDENNKEFRDVGDAFMQLENHMMNDPHGRGLLEKYELALERFRILERVNFYKHGLEDRG